MKSLNLWVVMLVVCLFFVPAVWAQAPASGNQSASPASTAPVPRLIKFSGTLLDAQSRPVAGLVGVTFSLYAQQTGGAALWMETQNVNPDANGVYTILLGAESSQGVPGELFATGEARWLGIQVERQAAQERILLVSVPYALKAADAETLGGLPASAYALAQTSAATGSGAPGTSGASGTSATGSGAAPQGSTSKSATNAKPQAAGAIASNFLPVFTNSAGALGSSVLFQNPTSNFLGLGTMSPLTPLDLRLTGTGSGGVVSVGNQTGGGRFGVLGFSTGAGEPFIVEGDLNDDLVLGANFSEKMRITSAGNVGVGTSAPFAPLDVKGVANQVIVEGATSGGEASMGFAPGGSLHKWQAGVSGVGPGFFVYENGGGYRLVVREGGHVGIGTTSPANPLVVTTPGSTGLAAVVATGGTQVFSVGNAGDGGKFTGGAIINGNGGFTNSGGSGVSGTGGGGQSTDSGGNGGTFQGGVGFSKGGDGIFATGGTAASLGGFAGNFNGNVSVNGSLSKSSGSFQIDHPLDPTNKYLYHSFVESPDMMDIYDGIVVLDSSGEGVVEFPDWFSALNRDFRYQLTCIGGFAPVYVAGELTNNRFRIAGGKAGMRISWQVTGIRQDPWANAHRIPVEQEKEAGLRGYYIHPELYGEPEEKQIEWARHPQMMSEMKKQRVAQRAGITTAQAQPPQTSHAQSAVQPPAQPAGSVSSEKARSGGTKGAVNPR